MLVGECGECGVGGGEGGGEGGESRLFFTEMIMMDLRNGFFSFFFYDCNNTFTITAKRYPTRHCTTNYNTRHYTWSLSFRGTAG